jgi:hypothetical protein
MKHENLVNKMKFIIREIERIDKENHTEPDEPTDPRIVQLLEEGQEVQNELDPIVRDTFRNQPEILTTWDKIMHMCDDDEDDGS